MGVGGRFYFPPAATAGQDAFYAPAFFDFIAELRLSAERAQEKFLKEIGVSIRFVQSVSVREKVFLTSQVGCS